MIHLGYSIARIPYSILGIAIIDPTALYRCPVTVYAILLHYRLHVWIILLQSDHCTHSEIYRVYDIISYTSIISSADLQLLQFCTR